MGSVGRSVSTSIHSPTSKSMQREDGGYCHKVRRDYHISYLSEKFRFNVDITNDIEGLNACQ